MRTEATRLPRGNKGWDLVVPESRRNGAEETEMAQEIYRDDLAATNHDPYIEPRTTASYIREPSRPVGLSPFILAVAIAAAIALASVALVGMPKQLANAPTTSEQSVPASR
jgi:hypothetical protein